MPDVIRETEAEHRRCAGRVFERCFPCTERPSMYQSLFEVQRYNNIVVKRWLISEKKKKKLRMERRALEEEEQTKDMEALAAQLQAVAVASK